MFILLLVLACSLFVPPASQSNTTSNSVDFNWYRVTPSDEMPVGTRCWSNSNGNASTTICQFPPLPIETICIGASNG